MQNLKAILAYLSTIGPVLTFMAALIAAGVAVFFGTIQARIARQQAATAAMAAKTAEHKLRADQFDKRLAIYEAVTEYMNASRVPGAWEVDATPHLQAFAAAKWLFGSSVTEWLYGELQEAVISLKKSEAQCMGVEPGPRLAQLRLDRLDELARFNLQYERRDEVFGRWLRLTDE
jgi:hypothetical protein